MTVSSTTNKVSYSGNGSTTVFAYTFKIFADADLTVIVRSATGTETTKTLNTHYVVTNAGTDSGGNVLFKFNTGTSSDAHYSTTDHRPASGETVVILRTLTKSQGTDYVENDPFPSTSHEDALDRLTFITQELQEEVDRTIKLSKTNTMTSPEFTTSATDRASKILSFDSSGELSVTQELGTFKGDWAASTAYVIRDIVKDTSTALAQFRIPVRSGDADMSRPDLTSLLEDYGGSDDIRNMAKLYNQGAAEGDNVRKADLARKFSGTRKAFDAVYEAWINILLSSPVTHSKNIIGAFLTTFAHVPETFAGATVGAIRRSLGGEGGMTFGEAKAVMFATVMSIKDAWSAAGKGFATGERVLPGSKIEPEKGKRNAKAFSAEGMDLQGNIGTAVDILGRFMTLDRIPTRALEFEDAFFKGIAYKQSLYQDAYRTGTQSGKTGDALSEYIAEYITNPPKNAIIRGEAHAKYVTLQSDLSTAGKSLSKVRRFPGIRYFIPFFKTPYNATKYALADRTPLGIYAGDARRAIEKGSAPGATSSDRAAADLAKGRIALGSTTTMLIAYFASQGYITGGGPTDRDFAKTKKRMGWKPYSFRVPDGEGGYQYVSYQFSEPFASIVGIAADLGEAGLNGDIDIEDWTTIANKVALVLSNQITDKTFMSGFANLINTISDPTRYTKSTVDSFIRSFTPRIVAQAEKIIDPVAREGRTLMDNFRQQIPGLSSTLEARRNVWGIPIIVDDALGPDIVSPIYRSFYGVNKQAPDQNYAKRAFKMDEIFNSIKYGPSRHPETFPQLGNNKTQKLALTNQELALYHELAGKNFLEQSERFFEQSNVQDFLRVARKGNKDAQKILDSKLTLLLSASRQKAAMDIINNSKFSDSIRDRLDRVNDEYVKELEDLERELNE